MNIEPKRFTVALSFPGERREFLSAVAELLANKFGQAKILYDVYHEAEFARPGLDVHLPNLYCTQSELIAIFLCAEYASKRWCRLEWRYIRQLIETADEERIMFLSFDDVGAIPEIGILSGDGYVNIGKRSPVEITELILERLFLGVQPNDGDPPIRRETSPEWLTVPTREWTGTPGGLLRADHAAVPFHGREDELKAWKKWIADPSNDSVALLTGPGGMGKTRLAREICLRLREDKVPAGFVDPSDIDRCIGFLNAKTDAHMLIVIDYAETLEERLADILRVVVKRNLRALRILFLARGAGQWWTALKRMGGGVGELLTREPEQLAPLTLDIETRERSYELASSAFAEKLGRPKSIGPTPNLNATHFERALLVQMSALLAAQNIQAQGMDSILEAILAREVDYWSRELRNRQLPKILEPGFERVMGIISGYGGARDKREAVEIISRIAFFGDQPRAVVEAVADILHDCYPGPPWIEPIQPDLLKEYLVEKATKEYTEDFKRIIF